ncbi:hypothetical protein [Tengunoibacter tsumagoiensis]|uniref:Uncharacterized protein n=1 Tax=Tengunoibacter tsumagoiensis TaxID=2014871 RepID=A0A402A1N4_9CHLR|nr:hypothetical protein [Tengunoibacter tsumagoiensis]GCE12959.1 hypothetical protein KTT_28180 [Tengunoibacter tsumagoiensis]
MRIFLLMRAKRRSLYVCMPLLLAICLMLVQEVQAQGIVKRAIVLSNPHSVALHQGQLIHSGAAPASAAIRPTNNSFVDTIPFWGSDFTFNSNVYPFQMVGTDPSQQASTTSIATEIIPLNVVFADGVALDGTQKVAPTVASPIFQKADFSSGNTQYGDAIQRAEFWKTISAQNPNYHVVLRSPKVFSTFTLHVPASMGVEGVSKRTGSTVGEIDIDWFDLQLQTLLSSLKISPRTLPIFLTYNTFLYTNFNPSQCCIMGYHAELAKTSASGRSSIYTYIYSTYSDAGLFGTFPIADVSALSHEVSEWYNDPFTDNQTPTWSSPLAPQYGCNSYLEVGDPLVGIGFTVNGYNLQDEAFYSWFAKQPISLGINGQFTYLNSFSTPSPTC